VFASYDSCALHRYGDGLSESELGSRVEACVSLLHLKKFFTLTALSQSHCTVVKTEMLQCSGVVLLIVCVSLTVTVHVQSW